MLFVTIFSAIIKRGNSRRHHNFTSKISPIPFDKNTRFRHIPNIMTNRAFTSLGPTLSEGRIFVSLDHEWTVYALFGFLSKSSQMLLATSAFLQRTCNTPWRALDTDFLYFHSSASSLYHNKNLIDSASPDVRGKSGESWLVMLDTNRRRSTVCERGAVRHKSLLGSWDLIQLLICVGNRDKRIARSLDSDASKITWARRCPTILRSCDANVRWSRTQNMPSFATSSKPAEYSSRTKWRLK